MGAGSAPREPATRKSVAPRGRLLRRPDALWASPEPVDKTGTTPLEPLLRVRGGGGTKPTWVCGGCSCCRAEGGPEAAARGEESGKLSAICCAVIGVSISERKLGVSGADCGGPWLDQLKYALDSPKSP
eukprot:scaffold31397_cov31-Tisochrysis_lutea.AAC.3